MVTSTASSKSIYSPKYSQARPRHPYAFSQCEGSNCVECIRENQRRFQLPLENCQSLIDAMIYSTERNIEIAHSLRQRLWDFGLFLQRLRW